MGDCALRCLNQGAAVERDCFVGLSQLDQCEREVGSCAAPSGDGPASCARETQKISVRTMTFASYRGAAGAYSLSYELVS
jgi:hypothetical protein